LNYRLISKVLGILLFIVAGATAAGWFASLFEVQLPERRARGGFLFSTFLTASAGAALYITGRGCSHDLLRKESLVIVGLGWVISGIFGTLPYLLCEPGLNFAGALFESLSGYTTTGSTVISNLDAYPRSIIFYRSLTQWLGGVGILVLFVAVLSFLGAGSRALMQRESSVQLGEASIVRIRNLAIHLWIIYIAGTFVCFAGLVVLGMPLFDSLNHAFTTLATAGFSPENASIRAYDSVALELWIIFWMLFGSLSFILYHAIWKRRWSRVLREEEALYYLAFLLAGIGLILLTLLPVRPEASLPEMLREVVFPAVAVSTTTGFTTTDYDDWPTASRLVLVLLVLVGGCAGSTAGGLKMHRVILFVRIARQELVKYFRPNQVFRLRVNQTVLDDSVRLSVLFHFAAFGAIFPGAVFLVALLEPSLDFESCFGCVVATFTNLGPGFAAVGPWENFSDLRAPTRILLSLLMVMGRLELFAILVLFVPSLWRRY